MKLDELFDDDLSANLFIHKLSQLSDSSNLRLVKRQLENANSSLNESIRSTTNTKALTAMMNRSRSLGRCLEKLNGITSDKSWGSSFVWEAIR